MINLGEIAQLDVAFFDALKGDSQRLIETAKFPKRFAPVWPKLLGLLVPARRGQFCRWLRDRLVEKAPSAEFIRKIFDLFGSDFPVNADFPMRANDVVNTIVDPILAEGTPESVKFLEERLHVFTTTISAAAIAEQQSLLSRITALVEAAAGDDSRTQIEDLAGALGINLQQGVRKEGGSVSDASGGG